MPGLFVRVRYSASGGKPTFLTSSCLNVSGQFVIERLSIRRSTLTFNNLRVGKAGLPPLVDQTQS